GLDPQVRQDLWSLIDALRTEGVTVVMSTHYIEEAERLSDEVALMSAGRIVERGIPTDLVAKYAGATVEEYFPDGDGADALPLPPQVHHPTHRHHRVRPASRGDTRLAEGPLVHTRRQGQQSGGRVRRPDGGECRMSLQQAREDARPEVHVRPGRFELDAVRGV